MKNRKSIVYVGVLALLASLVTLQFVKDEEGVTVDRGSRTSIDHSVVAAQKPGASVSVDAQLPKDWVVGQANSVRLTFRAGVKQAQLQVSIKERHGAALTGQTQMSYDLSANENMEALVELNPPADGYYQLDVSMKVTNALGKTQLRINSVPINIGVARSAKPAIIGGDSTGEVILPATETYE